jgi:hypothetical protein
MTQNTLCLRIGMDEIIEVDFANPDITAERMRSRITAREERQYATTEAYYMSENSFQKTAINNREITP